MSKPPFDDIKLGAEPEDENHAGGPSIRNVSPLATQERADRRARRAERRHLEEGSAGRRDDRGMKRLIMWGIAILAVLLALAGVAFVFIGKTTITVTPTHESIQFAGNVVHTAYKDPEAGELGYSVLTRTFDKNADVPASGREYVEERASGQIIVYNNFSTASQRLIKNTRFEAPNGDVYRVRDSFVVPGQTKRGENTVPGSIEVTVYADAPGEKFNISNMSTRFTIPGLEGDPRFAAFHAEMRSPIAGGFIGERAMVDDATLASTRAQLQSELTTQALQEIKTQSEDVVLFEDAVFISFESLPAVYGENEVATVREKAVVRAVVFDKFKLGNALAVASLATPIEGKVSLENPDDITFSLVNKEEVDIDNDALIQFTLKGGAMLVWDVDVDSLKQDLVGKHNGALNTIMSGYPGIESARATIRPFWRNEFPTETGSIVVEIVPNAN
jgi:hypothetical protein